MRFNKSRRTHYDGARRENPHFQVAQMPGSPALFEALEPRTLLSVIPPASVTVTLGYREVPDGGTCRAHLSWADNNSTETGYRAEYSVDGITNWQSTGNDLNPNATTAWQILDAGQKYFYRVRALEGTNVSLPSPVTAAYTPFDRAVQVSASANATDGTVSLEWPNDPDAVSYNVLRKERGATTWNLLTLRPLPARATGYVDYLPAGTAAEYQVQRLTQKFFGTADGTAVGYVYAGNAFAAVESRGTALLVVDETLATALAASLATYRTDLIGDGWTVDQILVPRDNGDAHLALTVKSLIQAEAARQSDGLQSIVLIGHVPVPYSGTTAWDSHPDHAGAWPADTLYGESIGVIGFKPWTDIATVVNTTFPDNDNRPGDGKMDQDAVPNPINVPVGRIDFANLPGMKWTFSPAPADTVQTEAFLLQRYFSKDHLWRTGAVTAAKTAIEDDEFGSSEAETGWRNFAPLVGAANTFSKDWQASNLANQNNLWSCGLGPGTTTYAVNVIGISQLHTTSVHVSSVFNLLYGSYFGDWNKTSNIMREVLASQGTSLVSLFGGTPNLFLHTMGLGETIGEAMMLTQNNTISGPYTPASVGMQCTASGLLGDPTLTQAVAKPVTQLAVSQSILSNTLTWTAPADEGVSGYYVYRAASPSGPFTRIGSTLSNKTQYIDSTASLVGSYAYMVRAIDLESGASGSYFNLSNGVMVNAPPRIIIKDGSGSLPLGTFGDLPIKLSSDSIDLGDSDVDPLALG